MARHARWLGRLAKQEKEGRHIVTIQHSIQWAKTTYWDGKLVHCSVELCIVYFMLLCVRYQARLSSLVNKHVVLQIVYEILYLEYC